MRTSDTPHFVSLVRSHPETPFLPEWMRDMPNRPKRTREERLLDIVALMADSLDRERFSSDYEWELAVNLALQHARNCLREFSRMGRR
jgi:hypothetical protein